MDLDDFYFPTTAGELAKLNARLDRYEKRFKRVADFFHEMFDDRSFWYALGIIVGSL